MVIAYKKYSFSVFREVFKSFYGCCNTRQKKNNLKNTLHKAETSAILSILIELANKPEYRKHYKAGKDYYYCKYNY